MKSLLALGLSFVLAALAVPGWSQTGGGYDLTRNTIDGGGATFLESGGYRLGATAGQPAAGTLNGGAFVLRGGFWPVAIAGAPPTATPTGSSPPTVTRSATRTQTPLPTMTGTSLPTSTATSAMAPTSTQTQVASLTPTKTPTIATPMQTATGSMPPSATVTATRSATSSPTATATDTPRPPTPTKTATPTGTRTILPCIGDCDESIDVTVDELIVGVNIRLGHLGADECPAFDLSGSEPEMVAQLVQAVEYALAGCP